MTNPAKTITITTSTKQNTILTQAVSAMTSWTNKSTTDNQIGNQMKRPGRRPLRKINNKIILRIRPTRASTGPITRRHEIRILIRPPISLTGEIRGLISPTRSWATESRQRATRRSKHNKSNGNPRLTPTNRPSERGPISLGLPPLIQIIGPNLDTRQNRKVNASPKWLTNLNNTKEKSMRSLQMNRPQIWIQTDDIEKSWIKLTKLSSSPRKNYIKCAMCSKKNSKLTTRWNKTWTPTTKTRRQPNSRSNLHKTVIRKWKKVGLRKSRGRPIRFSRMVALSLGRTLIWMTPKTCLSAQKMSETSTSSRTLWSSRALRKTRQSRSRTLVYLARIMTMIWRI